MSNETKEQLNQEYRDIKYILTSSMRTKLLLTMYDKAKNLEDLRNELKKPSATILHGLKELENENLIKKIQKYYQLTSSGYLLTTNLIKLIDNWYSIDKNRIYWNNHELKGIPEEMLKKTYLLKNCEYIQSTTSDLSNAFNHYINLLGMAENLKIILPIYSENHLKQIIKLLKDGKIKEIKFIINSEILESIEKNPQIHEELLKYNNVELKLIKKQLNLFLTTSENFMSMALFFKDGHYDDSQILIGKDMNSIKWADELYSLYDNYK